MRIVNCPVIVTLAFLLTISLQALGQSQKPEKSSLAKVIKDFQAAIVQKDSVLLKSLFFDKQTPVIGMMSAVTEMSIKKSNPLFEGLSVSNSDRFVREICQSPKVQSEKFAKIRIDEDERVAEISFDYAFFADGKIFQWGQENWSLVFAENHWFITGINFTIRYPGVEKVPGYLNKS